MIKKYIIYRLCKTDETWRFNRRYIRLNFREFLLSVVYLLDTPAIIA